MVALPDATADGSVLFAKNSDREANEAQYLQFLPREKHEPSALVRCTYVSIPQASQTCAVLLSRPYWMWGAEMGANEHGLVIGNEAVFARQKPAKEPALIGMDLVRLGLERATTADEALDVIIGLLETHGQGGNCGHSNPFYYDNSFLIADPSGGAWVLETVGRYWIAERVRSGVRSISNTYSIGRTFDRISDGLIDLAVRQGWASSADDFHFSDAFTDRARSRLSTGFRRWCRTSDLLQKKHGVLSVADLFAILRDHGPQAARNPRWQPDGITGGSVCAHASWGPFRFAQSTASLVSRLSSNPAEHWVTATSAPDTSIFKPVAFGSGVKDETLPDFGPVPGGRYDPASIWWQHERLHRAVLENYPERLASYRSERDRLEKRFLAEAATMWGRSDEQRNAWIAESWAQAATAEKRWMQGVGRVRPAAGRSAPSMLYRRHWSRLNRVARMPA